MIPSGVQIFVCIEPVDMRLGFERLSGLIGERTGYAARGGSLFVFLGKRRETAKILFFDGTGICLFHKRLDRGTFAIPGVISPGAAHVEVDDATFEALLDGIAIGPTPTPKKRARKKLH